MHPRVYIRSILHDDYNIRFFQPYNNKNYLKKNQSASSIIFSCLDPPCAETVSRADRRRGAPRGGVVAGGESSWPPWISVLATNRMRRDVRPHTRCRLLINSCYVTPSPVNKCSFRSDLTLEH